VLPWKNNAIVAKASEVANLTMFRLGSEPYDWILAKLGTISNKPGRA